MNIATFSIRESLSSAWKLFTQHWMVLVGAMVLMAIIQSFPGYLMGDKNPVAQILSYLISIFLSAGMMRIYLDATDGKMPDLKDLFSQGSLFLKALFASVIMWIAIIVGLILLIIPGVYIATRLFFVMAFVIDKGLGPIEAIRASWALTEGQLLHLVKLWLTFVGILILGALALIVGLLVAVPVATLMLTIVYRKLAPLGAPDMEVVPVTHSADHS
jgi:uncharacterized membrane protein